MVPSLQEIGRFPDDRGHGSRHGSGADPGDHADPRIAPGTVGIADPVFCTDAGGP
jgi:hypothetical protein